MGREIATAPFMQVEKSVSFFSLQFGLVANVGKSATMMLMNPTTMECGSGSGSVSGSGSGSGIKEGSEGD